MGKKKRTRLSDRTLPDYTRGEEIFNMVSHIVGGSLAVAALVLCVIFSAIKRDAWAVVSSAIYGGTMVALYTMSSIYHGLTAEKAKKVFQIIDHCTIYFLIAGTYTAITLAGIRNTHPVIAFVIFGIVWACCLGAATFTAIDLEKYKKMAMICYLGMGWCIIFFIKPTIELLGLGGMVYLISGGIAYTIGAVLYEIGKTKRYMHSIFHLFVIAGSVLHFFMILFYVIMR
ncbi:MAG: hemolysin III family protein [Clostridiales bacterium]|nr:hemolysin III family protein [Eubacterium sp.]MDD5994624.1 hemolysin III family protein [Clostridiales bacterium]MDD7350103.1 hemolysin III family protein [Clostridiales bacterium]